MVKKSFSVEFEVSRLAKRWTVDELLEELEMRFVSIIRHQALDGKFDMTYTPCDDEVIATVKIVSTSQSGRN